MASERKIQRVQQKARETSRALQQSATQSPLGPSAPAPRSRPAPAPAPARPSRPSGTVAPPAGIGRGLTADELLEMQRAVDQPSQGSIIIQQGPGGKLEY